MTANNLSYGPQYYKRGSIEVWDFIRDQGLNYHLGNAIKYICRVGFKGDPEEDLKKAIHYLTNELEHVSNNNPRSACHISDTASEGVPRSLQNKEWTASD
jgi:hypothetical protein